MKNPVFVIKKLAEKILTSRNKVGRQTKKTQKNSSVS